VLAVDDICILEDPKLITLGKNEFVIGIKAKNVEIRLTTFQNSDKEKWVSFIRETIRKRRSKKAQTI